MKPKSLCLLTCASFARETAALAGEADLVQVVFGIYPNRCGRPPLSWEEVRSVVGPPEQCAAIRIFGGCCLAALGDPPPDLAHCTVTRLENCFELVADQRTVAGLTASGSYLVSAGWLAQWQRHIPEWGFTRETAPQFFAESSRQIALLDTGVCELAAREIAAFADFVQRPFVILATGLGLFRLRVLLAREQTLSAQARHAEQQAQRRYAEYAMAFDLLSTLARSVDEKEVIRQTTNLYQLLFAAREAVFVSLVDEIPATVSGGGFDGCEVSLELLQEAAGLRGDYSLLPAGDGFLLKMSHGTLALGVIRIAGIALPEHLGAYLNLALATVGVCGLALNNARAFRELADKNRALAQAHAELQGTHLQLLQQEKMASLGRLAAGVAHEINNPLGFITSNLATLGRYATKIKEYLESVACCSARPECAAQDSALSARSRLKIDYLQKDMGQLIMESLDGTTRVTQIVNDLVNLSQPDVADLSSSDPNQCLQSSLNMVRSEIRSEVAIHHDLGELPEILCHPRLLSQAFLNLLTNAGQAIEGRGAITVRSWRAGDSIQVSVADNGVGIPQAILQRVFDPFFTTRAVGKGTGLGLSTSYDIIRKHGGDIVVESEPGRGSTFTVRLPITR